MPHATLFIAALLAIASPWAAGQTVYRCGSSYSQQPCAGGTAIDTAPAVSAGDRAQAASLAAADAKRADALEKARLEREKNAPKAVIPPPPPAPAEARKDAPRARGGKLEQFTAVSPSKPGADGAKKARKRKKSGEGKGA